MQKRILLVILVLMKFFRKALSAGSGYSYIGLISLEPYGGYLPYSMSGIITVGGKYRWITEDNLGDICIHTMDTASPWGHTMTDVWSDSNSNLGNVIR